MNQTCKGILINRIRYKDNSFVCRIFMEDHGLKSFLVQSGKSAKTSKANLLQPMTLVEFEAALKENVQLQRLKDLRLAVPLSHLHFDPVKSAMLLFLDEVLYKTIPDDYANAKLYHFLWNAVQLLDDALDARNFHIWCLLEISRHYGFYPFIEDEDAAYFDLTAAAFTKTKPAHQFYMEGENFNALFQMWNREWLQVQPLMLHSNIRKALLEGLVNFLKLHLENLREIKSLGVLHAVFH